MPTGTETAGTSRRASQMVAAQPVAQEQHCADGADDGADDGNRRRCGHSAVGQGRNAVAASPQQREQCVTQRREHQAAPPAKLSDAPGAMVAPRRTPMSRRFAMRAASAVGSVIASFRQQPAGLGRVYFVAFAPK